MAEAALARKKKIRAGHRASATRIMGQVDTAVGASPIDPDQLSLLKLTLNEKLNTLKKLDSEIIELIPETDLEDEIQQSDEYTERIYAALTRVNKAANTVTTESTIARPADPSRDREAKVKLPKISLPHFSGNPMKWTSFWDSFKSAVHDNSALSEVDKFNYLRSLLERTAYDTIAGLTLSDTHYREAIELLQKRFGDKQLIISKHMETLLQIEAVTSDQNLRDLRRLYDHTESHIRSLKSLGVEAASYGAMLSPVLLSKLPPDIRLIVSRKTSSTGMSMDSLLGTFQEELVARERATGPHQLHTQPRRNQERGRQATLLTGAQESGSGIVCCFCRQPHASKDCVVVTSVNDRKQSLRSSGRCFNCLRKGHLSRACRSSSKCQRCKGKHHTSICEAQPHMVESEKKPPSLAQPTEPLPTGLNPDAPTYTPTTNAFCSAQQRTVLLQTARAVVCNPSNPGMMIELRLLFDSGSQRSYITERAMKMLALEPTSEQFLSIATFASTREQAKVCPTVNVKVCLRGYAPMLLSLYAIHTICEPLVSQPITACKQFMSLDLADSSDGVSNLPVDMLIGSDYYWDLVTGSICKIERGPTAVHTKLGWVLSGPIAAEGSQSCSMNLTTTHVLRADAQSIEPTPLDEQLRSFWELESLGIHNEEKTLYDDFANRIAFCDGRYRVSLPWREFHEPLPTNHALCLKRLRGLLCRLKQEPEVLREYDSTIKDQLERGIIEAVVENGPKLAQVHYLPHHAVVRRDKSTTKLRIVYDASARSEGPSLNDCLHKGPKFNQLILDLLLRFRSYKVALTADVEKAFLMIAVENRDRDVLRFLWVDDVLKDEPEIRVYRFTRVVFGVSSSPFLLNATVRFHLDSFMESNEAVVKRLLQSTYVDDIVSGAGTDEEAFELYAQAKDIFRHGGFNLRKFVTNSAELQQRINHAESVPPTTVAVSASDLSDETYAQATLGTQHAKELDECKILGVPWIPENDLLVFDVSSLAQVGTESQPTKRNVVSLVGRFYDPLGFLSPITIRFKILFQRLCRNKLGWDDTLPEELLREWNELIADLGQSGPISIPRSYFHRFHGTPTTLTLCGFCDASTQAYAAVIYLVLRSDTDVAVKFIVAKTRVVPLRPQTIPRLELLSAFLLSKLVVSTIDSLSPTLTQLDVRCYTDSQVALHWIRGVRKEWKPFVQNRVNVIRDNVPPDHWNHCPGKSNPADLPSRGLTALELSVNQLWRQGPEWLLAGVDSCPQLETPSVMPEECSLELKAKAVRSLNLVTTNTKCPIGKLIECEKFGSLTRLLRVTAQVLRAVEKFKTLRNHQSNPQPTVTPEQIAKAEVLWITNAQLALTSAKSFKLQQKQFNLFKDEKGIWRCGGRLSNSEAPYAVKHPVLLPRADPLSTLIVREAHERVFHNGVRETLTEVRRRFWIPKARSLTRQVIHYCIPCKKFEGAPYKAPPPPPLPTFRVKEDPGFTYTGVDFAGPLYVRCGESPAAKVWICLFTCLVTRAIHLDVVPDQSTQSFIRCLKRFAARRGLPAKLLSDNGKTFKAAAKYIRNVMKDGTVKTYLTGLGTEWLFNVERAPWWGGAFERMVQTTKRCLRKIVGRAQFTSDELVTVLAEIEAVVNSRPLSYVAASDMEEPLTPSHLLVGRRILNLPDHLGCIDCQEDPEFSLDSNQLTKRMKHLNNVLNHFWNRWRSEYLAELRETHSYTARRQSSTQPTSVEIGDIVIVHDERLPRGLWKLGRIVDVMRGRDGQIRGATVKMASEDGHGALLRRPIQLLFPLEVKCQEPSLETVQVAENSEDTRDSSRVLTTSNDESNVEEHDKNDTSVCSRHSKRTAAKEADERRKACMFELEDN